MKTRSIPSQRKPRTGVLGATRLILAVLAVVSSRAYAQYPIAPKRLYDPLPTFSTFADSLSRLNTLPEGAGGLVDLFEAPSSSAQVVDSSQNDTSAVGRASGRDSTKRDNTKKVIVVRLRPFVEAQKRRAADSAKGDTPAAEPDSTKADSADKPKKK